ncbi:ceramide glucosyltransferase [Myxococcaceae bacterium GXIMD 01537]
MPLASLALLAAALFGLTALLVQLLLVLRHRAQGRPPVREEQRVGISILKPLCGVDDDLEANLEQFAALDYPAGRYEVVLGVKDTRDAAYAVARRAVERWPDVMRLALQEGEPGLNPKVNQLVTLAAHARHDLFVISDSNVRVGPGYLDEIAEGFADPEVGCVTHPVSGIGERTLGSLLDNLYLTANAAAGMIAAKRVAGQDIVVGKSMALRREDVESLGGFFSVKDVLAEDYVIGRWVTQRLGKRVVMARTPVFNVSQDKSLGAFFRRYLRWSIIHHTAVSPLTSLAHQLLNPVPLTLLGALLHPTRASLAVAAAVTLGKVALDVAVFRLLRREPISWRAFPAVLLKDGFLLVAWAQAFFNRTVDWRGTKLRVTTGTRLVPIAPAAEQALPAREELLAG